MSRRVLILGATSDIGMALGEIFATNGYHIVLAARNEKRLLPYASNIEIKYSVGVEVIRYDAESLKTHQTLIDKGSDCNILISTVGYLGDQKTSFENIIETTKQVQINFLGIITVINQIVINWTNTKNSGKTIIGISSVAGDRGRMSNFIYGSTKSAFSTYLSGLRNYLYQHNIHVITVKPGFVQTKMTEHLSLPQLLTTSPKKAARSIYKSYLQKKNIVYILPIWKWIMLIIRLIPERVFKKLQL